MELTDREWRCFGFADVFDIRKGFYNKKPDMTGEGIVPFLGATANDNGVTGWCTTDAIQKSSRTGDGKNEPMEKKLFQGGCIAVTNDGSVGHAYYQPTAFTCSHSINPLYLRGRELTTPLALFLITMIEKQAVGFEYARKWRPARMVKSRLMLPVTDGGEPDYDFMEQYVKELMIDKYMQYMIFDTHIA